MTAQIFTFEQGTPEWKEARRGIPTASEFSDILTGGKTHTTYMRRLAGEILTGEPDSWGETADTRRGHHLEPEARELYEFQTGYTAQQVGFIRSGNVGASPDFLVGTMGAGEIKTKKPHLQIEVLESGEVPTEHIPQCQGVLWVSDREWIDFISYWPRLPIFIKRLYRDEAYIKKLAGEVNRFNDELAALVERLRQMDAAA